MLGQNESIPLYCTRSVILHSLIDNQCINPLASQLKLISLQDGTASIEKALHLFSTPDFKQAALKMIFGDTTHVRPSVSMDTNH